MLEAERRFRILVQGVTDYAIYMLDPEGHVTNWNAGAERIKGYAPTRSSASISAASTRPRMIESTAFRKALETARATGRYEAEGWRVRKDGTQFWASVVIDAIRDESGELIGFAKITRDMTERREASSRLQERAKQLFPRRRWKRSAS